MPNIQMFLKSFVKSMWSLSPKISKNPQPISCQELETNISINPKTQDPDLAWQIAQVKIKKEPCERLPLNTPIFDNKIRFVCISDTHGLTNRLHHEIPPGDVLIHAGDFTKVGTLDDVIKFSNFLESLNHKFKYKVVIAGNHELTFDKNRIRSTLDFHLKNESTADPRECLKNCIYLEDSLIELFGIKIYGAPWQPTFGGWAFNIDRGEPILKKWNKIPNNTDILITHGPPLGFGDIVNGGYNVGCCELLTTIVSRVRPKYHIFGHIHEDAGLWTDGCTTYINASTCNFRYVPMNPPIIFDIDLLEGKNKEDFLTYE